MSQDSQAWFCLKRFNEFTLTPHYKKQTNKKLNKTTTTAKETCEIMQWVCFQKKKEKKNNKQDRRVAC